MSGSKPETEAVTDSVCVSPYQYFPSSNLLYFCLCLLPCGPHRPADNPKKFSNYTFLQLLIPHPITFLCRMCRSWSKVSYFSCARVLVWTFALCLVTFLWQCRLMASIFILFSWIKLYIFSILSILLLG